MFFLLALLIAGTSATTPSNPLFDLEALSNTWYNLLNEFEDPRFIERKQARNIFHNKNDLAKVVSDPMDSEEFPLYEEKKKNGYLKNKSRCSIL